MNFFELMKKRKSTRDRGERTGERGECRRAERRNKARLRLNSFAEENPHTERTKKKMRIRKIIFGFFVAAAALTVHKIRLIKARLRRLYTFALTIGCIVKLINIKTFIILYKLFCYFFAQTKSQIELFN